MLVVVVLSPEHHLSLEIESPPLLDPNQSVGRRSSLRFAGQEPSRNKPTSPWAQRCQVARPLQLLVLLSPPEELSDVNSEPAIFTARAGSESATAKARLPVSPWASIPGARQCHQDLRVVKLHILSWPSSPSHRRNITAHAHTNCQPPSRLRIINSSRSNPSSSLVSTSPGSLRSPHSKEPRHRSPSCPGGRRLQQPDPLVAISSVCRASNPGCIRPFLPLVSTSVDFL
jgi:hypothetical protein